jgi:cell division septation protein DedD
VSSTNDDGFREIQLNGKQLVFLFMAATVVSVVIFLCGVLVGRGVRPERVPAQDAASTEISPDAGAAAAAAAQTPTPPPAAATESPAPIDDPTYPGRLTSNTLPQETLKPMPGPVREDVAPVKPPPPKPQASKQPLPPKPPPPAEQAAASVAASEPSGPGFAVQVSIFDNRREADALAKQLIAKGYPAFVMDPVKGAPRPIYRVRVGKYKNRKDAEAISARLEKAEQFTPWIAR